MRVRHDMVTVFVARPDGTGASHEFLQLRRSAGDYMGGTWAIIRGGMESNETYVQAALRELREESGLVPRELFRLGTVESFYTSFDDTLWHSVAFVAIVERDQVVQLNDEHDDARWIPRDQIDRETLWPSERHALEDLCRDILDSGPARPYLRIDLSGTGLTES